MKRRKCADEDKNSNSRRGNSNDNNNSGSNGDDDDGEGEEEEIRHQMEISTPPATKVGRSAKSSATKTTKAITRKRKTLYVPVIGKEYERTEELDEDVVKFEDMPKKPFKPFFKYMIARRPKLLSDPNTKGMSSFNMSKVIAKEWNELSIQEKKRWFLEYHRDSEHYANEVKQKLQDIKRDTSNGVFTFSGFIKSDNSSNNNNNKSGSGNNNNSGSSENNDSMNNHSIFNTKFNPKITLI